MPIKFTNILKDIILESGKFEVLSDKYLNPKKSKDGERIKPLLSPEVFLQLIQADPMTQMNDVDPETATPEELKQIKPGKYSEWIIKHYLKPDLGEEGQNVEPGSKYEKQLIDRAREVYLEDLFKLTTDLKKYMRFQKRIQGERDFGKLTPSQLYNAVKDFSLEKTKASAEEKKLAQQTYEHPGGEIIFRGDKWTVVRISDTGNLGKDAACFYGGYYLEPNKGETRWCTSSPGTNWFYNYIKKGPLYVIIPSSWDGQRGEKSNLPAQRYQFHFPDNQFMDVHDRQVDLIGLLNGEMEELKPLFKGEFAKGLTVGGEKLEIDGFDRGAIGKFIGLYGLEELIESMPETIKHISLKNRDSSKNINIRIPESISKFQNLVSFIGVNCIASVPDSICELKKLNFITLMDCPNLKTVPGCIADLPRIMMLNLMGSVNCKVPEEIKQKAVQREKDGLWDFASDD